MARISLNPRRTLTLRLMEWYSRRAYGKVLEPGRALGHSPEVLRGYMFFERRVSGWNRLDLGLKNMAELAAAVTIGCSWCVDFGYWMSDKHGLPLEKISKVPAWRAHREAFTEVERLVMEYAEAMTETPPAVTDEMTERLLGHLGEAAFVELTATVAIENLRSRMNNALGLTSQGFSDSCAIPPVGSAT